MKGYDEIEIKIKDRVELHHALDMWMRGAKFGTLEGMSADGRAKVRLDLRPKKLFKVSPDRLRKTR